MTTAILDMEAAYTDAAGRALSDSAHLNVKAGLVAGETFTAGVYKWGSNVGFASDIYIKGNKDSLFLFQTTGNVVVGAGAKVVLLTLNPHPSTLNPQPSTLNPQPSTLNPQPSTLKQVVLQGDGSGSTPLASNIVWQVLQGSGFRVQGSGFRVQGAGFRVQGSGFDPTYMSTACFVGVRPHNVP